MGKKKVDFTQKFQFLYTKLAEINPDIMHEKRYADKLIKVFTKNGVEVWMLVHIEVQGYKDNDFAERMFTHFYCIRDKFKKNVIHWLFLQKIVPHANLMNTYMVMKIPN